MKEKILVTGIGGDIGQGVVRCLRDSGYDFWIIGCDIDAFAAGKALVDEFYSAPGADSADDYKELVMRIVKENNVKYIFPLTEAEIVFYDTHRSLFERECVDLFVHRHDILAMFLDKYETVEFFKQNNMLFPRTFLLDRYSGELQFPFILKARKGCGAKANTVVEDTHDLDYYKKKQPESVVQEMIGNIHEEYTVGVFSDGTDVFSVAFKRYLGYGSLSKVARLVDESEIKSLAEKVARTISLKGSINIQCRKTERGFVPFEINPRFSSTVYTRHYFGFQDVKWWIDHKRGKKIEYKPEFKAGVAVRNLGETYFGLEKAG